jgi:hypothetical protein
MVASTNFMRIFFHLAASFFSSVLVLALAGGCQAAPDAASLASSQQLMIKFKAATASCDRPAIARLSAAAGVPLEFVRPMSGNACVVRQSGPGANGLARGLDTLRKNSALEWVELDAVVKIQ